MPRPVRVLLFLIPLGLVLATVGVWLNNALRSKAVVQPTETQIKSHSADGIVFEVEHETKEGVNLFTSGGERTIRFTRRGDVLDYYFGLLTVNDIGMPDVKAGDTVRWNLEGPLLINGTPAQPHAVQLGEIKAPKIDLNWKVLESATPRDTLSIAWAGKSRTLITAHGDGAIRVWDVDKGEVLRTMVPDVPKESDRGSFGLRIDVSPDGKQIAATNIFGEEVTIWDLGKGTKAAAFKEPKGKVSQVAFADDKSFFESRGGKLLLQGLDGARVDWGKSVHDQFAEPFAFHPKTKHIAWNDGKKLRFGPSLLEADFEWEPMSLGCMAFSADGSLLAAFDGDSRLSLLDPKTGKEVKRLRWRGPIGAADSINALAFSPDGQTLAVGSSDSLRLYDVPTGRERGGLGTGWIRSLAYSADGRTLAAGLHYQPGLRMWNTADLVLKAEPKN